jgi:hypothetical protein
MNGTIINNYQVSIYHWLIEFVCWNLYLIKNKNSKTSFHLFILWMGIPFIAHISWRGITYYSPLAIGSSYLTSLGRFPLESVCAGQFVVIGF